MFNNRKAGQNNPKHIEQNDCRKSFLCGRPNKGNAGDDGEDIEPPELFAEKQAGEDDGNLGKKTPRLHGVDPCPVLLGRHGLYCGNNFSKKHE